jgi:hypothetical protein
MFKFDKLNFQWCKGYTHEFSKTLHSKLWRGLCRSCFWNFSSGFLVVGAATHATIFMVRDYDPTTQYDMAPFFFHGKGFSIIHYGSCKLKQKKPKNLVLG